MRPELSALRTAGIISQLDLHFAVTVARIAGETSWPVIVAAAMASQRVSGGHVCLDLPRLALDPAPVDDAGQPVAGCSWPNTEDWLGQLQQSALVAEAGAEPLPHRPLVLDACGRLYLRRYWDHQQRLAGALLARATQVEPVDAVLLRQGLDRLFPSRSRPPDFAGEHDRQRFAAAVALHRRFSVISGGPGTGKTFTVVKILALAIEQALASRRRTPHIRLAAPTGKAAARLGESIRQAKGDLDCGDDVKAAIPDEASTVHRLLGALRDSDTRFRHDADNPLVADIALIDEASMIDIALMSRLTDALPPQARVILLGDKDQLASVEAGSVLGDICNSGQSLPYSAPFVAEIERLSGESLPLADDAPRQTGIWDCITQLTLSYRYGPKSGIGLLARAVNAGDVALALDLLGSAAYPDIALASPPRHAIEGTLAASVVQGYAPFLQRGASPEERLRDFNQFRVLCAHRRGPLGVETIVGQIEAVLAGSGLLSAAGGSYTGRPLLVTRNDYQLGLFNGDVGIVHRDTEGGDAAAYFFGADGRLRRISPSRLPPHETAFAMSVHRAQGSEFDEVAVLLPDRVSPVVTRELLYTAVTRARRKVTIYATPEIVAAAIARPTERASGLRDALWG